MFAGRIEEITRLERALLQTRSGNPRNALIVGERGIGKSSLLFYLKAVAEGVVAIDGEKVRFLVIDTDLADDVTQLGLVRKIEMALRHQLGQSEAARGFLMTAWDFLQRVEVAGFSLKDMKPAEIDDSTIEEFGYSLAATIERLCTDDGGLFGAKYDGLLLIVDEADNASRPLNLGSFLKLLVERLQRRGCNRLMIALAGLPEIRGVLTASHPSSLRLFEELEMGRLSTADAKWVIRRGLERAKELNGGVEFTATEDAQDVLVSLSEGFPHFLQQFSYSAFDADTDNIIDKVDVGKSAFGRYGAMELIGKRYYHHDFYERIKQESYRQVLRIMADHLDEWVTKETIRKKFKGTRGTLDNALHALRKRHIIIPKEGELGLYRLQNKGFAFWIKVYTAKPRELGLEGAPPSSD
jgi:hypothetical protein